MSGYGHLMCRCGQPRPRCISAGDVRGWTSLVVVQRCGSLDMMCTSAHFLTSLFFQGCLYLHALDVIAVKKAEFDRVGPGEPPDTFDGASPSSSLTHMSEKRRQIPAKAKPKHRLFCWCGLLCWCGTLFFCRFIRHFGSFSVPLSHDQLNRFATMSCLHIAPVADTEQPVSVLLEELLGSIFSWS